ncbi:MAG TPA: hypothetical protein VF984_14980 [Actinomycetota bacterium]
MSFSLAFALQRALASELAYLALARVLENRTFNAATDAVVGAIMAGSGLYVLRIGRDLHLTEGLERLLHRLARLGREEELGPESPVPIGMTLVHGFIAGWGTGAFALIVYTKLAPAMPFAAVAFLPGLVFGVGTMIVQGAFGAMFGAWMRTRGLGEAAITQVARSVAGRTLLVGGLAFGVWGLAELLFPGATTGPSDGFATGIHVPGFDRVDAGTVLVAVVFVVAAVSFVRAARRGVGRQD